MKLATRLIVGAALCGTLPVIAGARAWAEAGPVATAGEAAALPAAADASTASADPSAVVDPVIVTGTRDPHRKARESVSPVDVVTAAALQQTGATSLRDALQNLLPSFNRPSLPTGNAALTDSAELRGLSPDDVLVLVNGKRRHTTVNLTIQSGPQQGSAPVDLDLIPISAIDHIEILRDGAAAQYGSDAIAGVINIILKSSAQGGSVSADGGAYYKGDGVSAGLSGDRGFDLGDGKGFVHLSGEYRHHDHSDRDGVDPRSNAYDNHTFGDPSYDREALGLNAGYTVNAGLDLYGFATYARRDANSLQNYRFPTVAPTVYPSGFNPAETIAENDFSLTAGAKGEFGQGWGWDLSTTYGGDYDSIGLIDSINTALLADNSLTGDAGSPTSFHIGSYAIQQWTNNLDITRPVYVGLASPLNLSFGAEYRFESYQVSAGDPASYYSSGAQAKDGLAPSSDTNRSRSNYAAYLELSQNITKKWLVDVAGRYEHYSDFGDVPSGKFSTRYDIDPRLAVRFTVSNGFRAPSLAQEYYSAVSVLPSGASGQLAANSEGAKLLGAPGLKPEKSTNFSTGFVAEPLPGLHMALDLYQIDIRNRIVDAGGSYAGTQAAADALTANGIDIAGLPLSGLSVNYFANGVATRTQGADFTADYRTNLDSWGVINWDLGINFNHTKVLSVAEDGNGVALLNSQGISYLSSDAPRNKIVLGGVWRNGPWRVSLHEKRYGTSTVLDSISTYTYPTTGVVSIYNAGTQVSHPTEFYTSVNKPRFVTDLEVGYDLTKNFHWAVGAENLFDTYPTKLPLSAAGLGSIYDTNTGVGINGGYYYSRVTYTF